MPSTPLFEIPPEVDLDTLAALLPEPLHLGEGGDRRLTRTWLDSFDWRLYRAGGLLEEVQEPAGRLLRWRDFKSGDLLAWEEVPGRPQRAADIPAGPVAEEVAPALGVRVLLPQVEVQVEQRLVRVLDDEEKTVLRLELEQARYLAPHGHAKGELAPRLRLVPVKGYQKELERVARRFAGDWPEPRATQMEEALTALGRAPGDYSSKLDIALDPGMRADEAAKAIHLYLLRILEANLEGTRADLDPEFLHDLRVAIRRTRSALTQIKGVFPPTVVENFKGRFAWVQQVTGPVRDLDVYLLDLPGYREGLPDLLRPGLAPLETFLARHHAEEQAVMARKLASPHFRKLLKDWRAFLEAPVPDVPDPEAPKAALPVAEVASARIWRMYRRVLREGRAISDDSPAEALHELRKSCKKLRYLMEFFLALYAAEEVRPLVKQVKVLLDDLGAFQDLEVQARSLSGFAGRMVEEKTADTTTLLSLGALIGGLWHRQAKARRRFQRTFADFDSAANGKRFRHLFRA